MANYIKDIRKKVGHDAIFMPTVGAVIYKDGKILLQKRKDNGKWATHGGAIEYGESYIEALNRELQEEINIKAINPELLGIYSNKDVYEYPNGDKVYILLNIFLVEEYDGNLEVDNQEVTSLEWFEFDDLPDNIHTPDLQVINDVRKFVKDRKVIIR